MAKNVDFLLNVEVKARELETYCLLKKELERRGYTVALSSCLYNKGRRHNRFNAKVLVSNGIDYWSNVNHALGMAVDFQKAISMTWEQNCTNGSVERLQKRDKVGYECANVAWGDVSLKRMIEQIGLDEKKIFICGNPVMDYCRPEFAGYYYSREEIAKKHSLDIEKKWLLFNSSFAIETIGKDECKKMDESRGWDYYVRAYDSETKSRIAVIRWLEKLVAENEEYILIYRPHPAEKVSPDTNNLSQKYDNFRIIRNYSARQWMHVSDKILTWISTSTVEAYFMKKSCLLLRPVNVDKEFDIELFKKSEIFINSYEKLEKALKSDEYPYPFSDSELIAQYYYRDDIFAYELLADMCEKVFKDDAYLLTEESSKRIYDLGKEGYAKLPYLQRMKRLIMGSPNLYKIYNRLVNQDIVNNHIYNSEIRVIENRIAPIISSRNKQL